MRIATIILKKPEGRKGRSDNDAARAAPAASIVVLVFLRTVDAGSTADTLHCGSAGRLLLVVSSGFAHEVGECLINVDPLLGGRLDELASKVFCQISALIVADLAFVLEVALVGDDDDGERVLVLDAEDLLVESADFFEGVARGDGVDEEEALSGAHVLLAHRAIFFLSGGVEHVEQSDLVIDDALFPVRVLDGGVVLVDEVALDELDRQGGLADASSADDDKLIFPQKLGPRN